MAIDWPDLKVTYQTKWFVCWDGPIRTLLGSYRVRIQFYKMWMLPGPMWLKPQSPNPQVWVIDPELKLITGACRLPHTYACDWRPPSQASLCLHFPDDEDWSQYTDLVAEKIVPWTSEWLHFYEGWLATGKFHGPGLHPGDEDYAQWQHQRETKKPILPPDDQQASYRASADSYIGRRIGTFASFPLMAAASRDCIPSLCFPNWRGQPSVDVLSEAISTSLPGLQPEASSPLALRPAEALPRSSSSTVLAAT
jgi:hypothetical protein